MLLSEVVSKIADYSFAGLTTLQTRLTPLLRQMLV